VPGKHLVASGDAEVRELARRAFSEFAIEPEFCDGEVEAFALLHRRYDGIVLDCVDVELTLQLLAGVRAQEDRSGTGMIALLPGEVTVQQALAAGASVALHKPFRLQHLSNSISFCFRIPRVDARAQKEKGRGVAPQPRVPI
jgi:DNA-binding response OmpR family regulator